MRKLFVVVTLAVMAVVGAVTAPKAQAQTYPSVSGLTPFSQGANYMSLPGYLRYRYLLDSGRWISREEAEQQVQSQGAPTGPAGG
jgi:hypothetical protein